MSALTSAALCTHRTDAFTAETCRSEHQLWVLNAVSHSLSRLRVTALCRRVRLLLRTRSVIYWSQSLEGPVRKSLRVSATVYWLRFNVNVCKMIQSNSEWTESWSWTISTEKVISWMSCRGRWSVGDWSHWIIDLFVSLFTSLMQWWAAAETAPDFVQITWNYSKSKSINLHKLYIF